MKRFFPQTATGWLRLVLLVIGLPTALAAALGAFRTEPALRFVVLGLGIALLVFVMVVLVRNAIIARHDRSKIIVLLTEFHDPEKQGITDFIANRLKAELDKLPDTRLVRLDTCIREGTSREEIERLGRKHHAAVLIWGWCDRPGETGVISTHFEVLTSPRGMPELAPELCGTTRIVSAAELNSFAIHGRIGSEMAATCLFTLGLARYAAEDWAEAARRFGAALKAQGSDARPEDSAVFCFYLGNAHCLSSRFSGPAENLKKAIAAYSEALKVWTLDRFPMDYAMTQNNLGAAYQTLAQVEDKADNCRKAIAALSEALKVRTPDRFPMDYAGTQNNLGNTYQTLAQVEDKAENCRKAIAAYSEALKVYTLDRFPMQYATTQNNLGAAYQTLAEVEDKAENCRKAEEAYTRALEVYRRQNMPEGIRIVEHNLTLLRRFCSG